VREYRRAGRNDGQIPALRAMMNDAARADAGRLVERNPFAGLRLRSSRGRRDVQPPAEAEAARMVAFADELTPPSFAAYLDVSIHEGARPGELDALRWDDLDFIHIERQWNVKVRKFTLPKHGVVRTVAMTPKARDRLLTLPRESEWVFTTLRGNHYTPSTRSHHWNRVRCSVGLGKVDLYTATRHHFAWYAWNVLCLDPADIAQHFGHQDGGELVRRLYGQGGADLHAAGAARGRLGRSRAAAGETRAGRLSCGCAEVLAAQAVAVHAPLGGCGTCGVLRRVWAVPYRDGQRSND
jgi:integrase